MTRKLPLLTLLVLLCLATPSWSKKDYNAKHHHHGVLKPYNAGPFELDLGKKDLDILSSGKPVMKQPPPKEGELGGGAICVQDVEAPKEAVWAQILDLDSYTGKVAKVKESKNYIVQKNDDGTFRIKTKMMFGILPGYSVRSFCVTILKCNLFDDGYDAHQSTFFRIYV